MADKLPSDYREQDGCWNCAETFRRREFDHSDQLYCTLAAPPRPPCGSVFMSEGFSIALSGTELDARWKPWDACLLRGHKWEPWCYVTGLGECDAGETCARCGAIRDW